MRKNMLRVTASDPGNQTYGKGADGIGGKVYANSGELKLGQVPLRVDFGGGWLDVPKFAQRGGYVVNCAITPMVSLTNWPYEKNGGLGGSAAWAALNGQDPVAADLESGAGWQDPAVIQETGLCVWRSGSRPSLEVKRDGTWLEGRLALFWTGKPHVTAELLYRPRPWAAIRQAGEQARFAVLSSSRSQFERRLGVAINTSYLAQLEEGMAPLVDLFGAAKKYCGSGHGGYAVYFFASRTDRDTALAIEGFRAVEPYTRDLRFPMGD